MRSIQFPNMLDQHRVQTTTDYEATKQNIHLLLSSEKGSFKFDPYFGIRLKRYTFEPNNYVLRDILAEEIYEQLIMFIPQITLKRSDITIETDKAKVYLTVRCQSKIDYTLNTYNLILYDNQE